ncbi:MAG: DUF1553 domain-containing protein [Rubripirellula sp.]|nr:DUF1553 domain-containing protein [Rubripirellula sp.]
MQSVKHIASHLIPFLVLVISSARIATANDPASIEFFEAKIRPVFIQHCYECHSPDAEMLSGSLRVDSLAGLLAGGDSGPAIVVGDPDASHLMSAIRYESSEMPPSGRLPDNVIQDFEAWIAAGAVDPRTDSELSASTRTAEIDWDQVKQYWAFRPRSGRGEHAIATLTSSADVYPSRGVIDDYLNHKLYTAGIKPNPEAELHTQLRRLCFDLTGLPPSIEMQDVWLADPTDRNWDRLVNQLLASSGFGEHWARHWMDVARYADSNGSDFNATYHEAWRYRDFLIRSLNEDRPFDQMIRQQIAGDLLPYQNDQERYDNVVATTFLMLGPKMLSERDKEKLVLDVVDEQIDTIGRAFLGLTLGCARCHDHKFDPIPTEDYYALAGIFQSTQTLNGESQKYVSTWNRVELPSTESQRLALKEYQEELKRLQSKVNALEGKLKLLKEKVSDKSEGIVVDDREAKKTGSWQPSTYFKHYVGEGYVHDDAKGKGEASIQYSVQLPHTGQYEVRVSHSSGSNRAAKVPIRLTTTDGEVEILLDQREIPIEPMWSSLGVFELKGEVETSLTIRNEGTTGYVIADAVKFIPQGDIASPPQTQESKDDQTELKGMEQSLSATKKELDHLKKNSPPALPVAMAPADYSGEKLADSPVHIRGEVRNLGKTVPRGFLKVCDFGVAVDSFSGNSGRLQLADWLTHAEHPLVSRVFVNRVWMHLFGEGLVRTVDNFGVQGERPTHPELLDHLAEGFIQDGWHLKELVREIVSSRVYRRSSANQLAASEVDPQNRLWWRIPRRRLDAESIRDAIVFSTGNLDRSAKTAPMAGRGVLVSSNNADSSARFDDVALPCRSIYLPIVRGYLPEFLLALDMADPDLLVGKRPTTNVPSQALVLINSEEVNEWAKETSSRVLAESMSLGSRVEQVSRLLLQRYPRVDEMQLAEEFFDGREENADAWVQYISAIYASSPFRFVD